MALSAAQSAFITKYVADQNLGRIRGKIARSQYDDFARRYNKTEEALSVLPTEHPSRKFLEPQMEAAKKDAESGNFKQAYRALEDVKNAAKMAANGYLAWITGPSLASEVKQARDDLMENSDEISDSVGRLESMLAALDRHQAASDCATLEEAATFRKAFAYREPAFVSDFESKIGILETRCRDAIARDVPDQIAAIRRKVQLAEKDGRMGEISESVAQLIQTERLAEAAGGLHVDAKVQSNKIAAYRTRFADRMNEIKSMNEFKSTEDWSSLKLDEFLALRGTGGGTHDVKIDDETVTLEHAVEEGTDGQKKSVFLRLMQEEEARIERARKRISDDLARDTKLSDGSMTGRDSDPVMPATLDTFDTAAALAAVTGPLPEELDNFQIMTKSAACANTLDDFLDNGDPGSEAYLDLLLKGPDELFVELARAFGVPENKKDCSESHRQLIENAVKEMMARVAQKSKNKMADDLQSITVDGTVYLHDKDLGGGANGKARRYKSSDGTQSIVVKSLNTDDPKERAPMAKEMRTHATLLKGPTVAAKDAVAEFKSAAISEDGCLHMVMADAGGTDLKNAGPAMLAMAEIGAIPPEARQAMVQSMMRDLVSGLKLMEEKNMIHNDLKPENILLGDDGRVRIIDFGESLVADEEGMEPSAREAGYGVSQTWEAPEHFDDPKERVDKGVDTYAIGAILQTMGGFYDMSTTSGKKFTSTGTGATALDRGANAAMAHNSEDRPSLDAIATSTYLMMDDEAARDYVEEDVRDLQRAATEFQSLLSKLNVTMPRGQVPKIVPVQSMVDFQRDIAWYDAQLTKHNAERTKHMEGNTPVPQKIETEIENCKKFLVELRKVRDSTLNQVREDGAADYKVLIEDETNTVDYGSGAISISAALKERETMLGETSKLRGEYYRKERLFREQRDEIEDRLYAADEDNAKPIQDELDKVNADFAEYGKSVNADLKGMADQANRIKAAIDDSLKDKLSDAAQLHLSEARLREVSSRFGASMTRGSGRA